MRINKDVTRAFVLSFYAKREFYKKVFKEAEHYTIPMENDIIQREYGKTRVTGEWLWI